MSIPKQIQNPDWVTKKNGDEQNASEFNAVVEALKNNAEVQKKQLRFDVKQGFTESEKKIGRENLGIDLESHSSEDTAGTTITFDKMRDYGLSAPIDNFTFDLSDANRGIVQNVYFNGTALPTLTQLKWLGESNLYFESGFNFLIQLEFKDNNNVLANLVKL